MKGLSLAMVLVVTASCAFLPMSPSVGGKALIVIGSDYAFISQDLRVTAMDGMEMAVLLKNQGYDVRVLVDNGQIPRFLSDPAPAKVATKIRTYLDETFSLHFPGPFGATNRTNIKAELKSIRETLKTGETFFFFYAGHSGNLYVPGEEDTWSEAQMNEALQLPNWVSSFTPDPETYFSDDDLAAELDLFPPENPKILVFDSCRSGGFIGQDGTIPLTGTTEEKSSLKVFGSGTQLFGNTDIIPSRGLVLSAAPEMLNSQGDGDYGDTDLRYGLYHGFFTYTFLEGVYNGLADQNRDGYISASEIYWYSHATMGRWALGGNYRPRISGGTYDIILFKSPQ